MEKVLPARKRVRFNSGYNDELNGKTVESMATSSGSLVLTFTDGTYCHIAIEVFSDGSADFTEGGDIDAADEPDWHIDSLQRVGLFTPEQIAAVKAEQKRKEMETDRIELERLQKKIEAVGGKVTTDAPDPSP